MENHNKKSINKIFVPSLIEENGKANCPMRALLVTFTVLTLKWNISSSGAFSSNLNVSFHLGLKPRGKE